MHAAPAGIARSSQLAAWAGAACALGAVSAGALALVWSAAFPWRVGAVVAGLVTAIVASALIGVVCVLQAMLWRRGDLGRARSSWWAHVAGYVVALVALGGFLVAAAWFDPGTLGFWLCLLGALLAGLAQSVGATQHLRADGPPGTLPTHLRRWAARVRDRDAAADAEQERVEVTVATDDGPGAAGDADDDSGSRDDQRGANR